MREKKVEAGGVEVEEKERREEGGGERWGAGQTDGAIERRGEGSLREEIWFGK